jgi:hypothetical protein
LDSSTPATASNSESSAVVVTDVNEIEVCPDPVLATDVSAIGVVVSTPEMRNMSADPSAPEFHAHE